MKNTRIARAIQHLDDDLISDIVLEMPKKKHPIWKTLATVAACLCLVCGLALLSAYLFLPPEDFFPPSVSEDASVSMVAFCRVEDRIADYERVELSHLELFLLDDKIGELYAQRGESKFYRLKDADDLEYLIYQKNDATAPELLRFHAFWMPESEENLKEFYAYRSGMLNDAELEGLNYDPIGIDEVLQKIYCVFDAEDLKEIRFEKSNVDNSKIGKSVDVKTVKVRDEATLSVLYEILASAKFQLVYQEIETDRVFCESEAYLNGQAPLSAQTERNITLVLQNGKEITFGFSPRLGHLWLDSYYLCAVIGQSAQIQRLIEIARIDMEYHYYGVNPEKKKTASVGKSDAEETACETATLPIVPVA